MAAAAISIIDRLIQLSTIRERNRERYFNNFIEPLYRDGEHVARDYLTLLTELRRRIKKAGNPAEVIEWLEEKRAVLQPLRIKVRALIDGVFVLHENKRTDKNLALFRKGLWGLMKGATSTVEDGHALTSEYGFGDHTVLDILYHARLASLDQESRALLTRQVLGQRQAIEKAWHDVVTAYAEMRKDAEMRDRAQPLVNFLRLGKRFKSLWAHVAGCPVLPSKCI
jgi:hypothetical protein